MPYCNSNELVLDAILSIHLGVSHSVHSRHRELHPGEASEEHWMELKSNPFVRAWRDDLHTLRDDLNDLSIDKRCGNKITMQIWMWLTEASSKTTRVDDQWRVAIQDKPLVTMEKTLAFSFFAHPSLT